MIIMLWVFNTGEVLRTMSVAQDIYDDDGDDDGVASPVAQCLAYIMIKKYYW